MTLFLEIIPVRAVSNDIILNAIFGGIISAIGVGIALKWGASTGGLDIIAMILSKIKDKPVGTYFFFLMQLSLSPLAMYMDGKSVVYASDFICINENY